MSQIIEKLKKKHMVYTLPDKDNKKWHVKIIY